MGVVVFARMYKSLFVFQYKLFRLHHLTKEWRVFVFGCISSSVLQIDYKELKKELSKREEQTESTFRQMEALNAENGDIQRQLQTSEEQLNDACANLKSTQEERNKLQNSLQETSQLCLQMESKLTSYKEEKEQAMQEQQSKIAELERMLSHTEEAAAAVGITAAEKAEMESRHREAVTESTSQVSKLIDQLSTMSSEKAGLASKFESVSSDLSTAKAKVEAQTNLIAQLESSVDSIASDRDAANLRVTELLAGNERSDRVLSSLQIEKNDLLSAGKESEETIVKLEAEVGHMENTISGLRVKAESLAVDLEASKSEIVGLQAQVDAANQGNITAGHTRGAANNIDPTAMENSTIVEYEARIKALQSAIDQLKESNDRLTTENTSVPSQSTEASAMMNDLMEVNKNIQLLKQEHEGELQRMKLELRDLRDNNTILEEGLQDVQVEKASDH